MVEIIEDKIDGKFFRLICNMYQGIISCVSINGTQSSFFPYLRVLQQRENLSPVLFVLFFSDFEDFMKSRSCSGISLEIVLEDLYFHLKLPVMLYADDTVIFGIDESSFQSNLDKFYEYAKMRKLDINHDKTKILIFGHR